MKQVTLRSDQSSSHLLILVALSLTAALLKLMVQVASAPCSKIVVVSLYHFVSMLRLTLPGSCSALLGAEQNIEGLAEGIFCESRKLNLKPRLECSAD